MQIQKTKRSMIQTKESLCTKNHLDADLINAQSNTPIAVQNQYENAAVETATMRARWARCWEDNQQLHIKLEVLQIQADALAEIANRRSVQFIQRLDPIRSYLTPSGSLRQRLWCFCIDTLCWCGRTTAHAYRAFSGKLAAARKPSEIPEAEEPSTAPVQAAVTPRTILSWSDSADDVPYVPRSWGIKQSGPSDDSFLSLLILASAPRSGSTLLQRICNARKGTLIWGEHNGALSHYADIYRKVSHSSINGAVQREEFFGQAENPNLWTANMCADLDCVQNAIVESARSLLNTLYGQYMASHDIVGFKEVRYGAAEVELLRQCYPNAQILLLVRHPGDTWNSTPPEWFPSFDEWVAAWNTTTSDFKVLANTTPNCHLIYYENLVKKDPKTLQIIAETARISQTKILEVLAHKIGSNPRRIDAAEREMVAARCANVMQWLGYR
jgi:hypothetical protein